MLLTEITLGSKQHADMIAAARAEEKLTVRKFIAIVKNSTMPQRDVDAILDVVDGTDLSKEINDYDLEQISAIADVSLGELRDLTEAKEVKLKAYTEITLKDVVRAAGGEAQIKSDYAGKSAEHVYEKLIDVANKLTTEKLKLYREVGEIDPTSLMDWVDSRFHTGG